MAAERREHGFIPGIFNYCDRWCERCPFTSRCRVYAIEMALSVDGMEGPLSEAAADLPPDPAEEGGFIESLEEGEAEEDLEAEVDREMLRRGTARLLAEAHPLAEAARTLMDLAGRLIEAASHRGTASRPDAQAAEGVVEVLLRYRFFIPAKVHRALSGRDEPPLLDERGQPFPSDADGTAKIAHVACAAAREAARRLGALDPALAPLAAETVRTADEVLQLIDDAFPGHRAFRRPGFDDMPAD